MSNSEKKTDSNAEKLAYQWAVRQQGFAGTLDDWLALSDSERAEYEAGSAGEGTI